MSAKALSISKYASLSATPVSLKQLIQAGSQKPNHFTNHTLQHELRVRIAHQIKRLEAIPEVRPINQLLRLHRDTFDSLDFSNSNSTDHTKVLFQHLTSLHERHSTNLETIMEGLMLLRDERNKVMPTVENFLQVNIGFQVLCSQFINSAKEYIDNPSLSSKTEESGLVGVVDTRCDIRSIVEEAIEETCSITERHMESTPDVIIESFGRPRLICCVPSYIHHILFEVLKNSLKATVSSNDLVTEMLPPVEVFIVWGKTEACIIIEDKGGGMSREKVSKAFQYLWTSSETFADAEAKHMEAHSYQPMVDPLSGMGIGLPISRLFARHFGGDLLMQSAEGYGTRVAIYIPKDNLPETIPIHWDAK
eukprot:CAMPEP_0171478118 /NCGR_PEP_ID=MMETSP0946-20130122/4588_1 /TAXON_ID=109269 /ORGANISM="Vaucheria litorea, Strain CCMP2940" /LENGTH=363 /DNA_ID=CAMNT_0012008695 /DNA_START=44 /DNA_END=1135 /DNA_ORIENTATION=-